MPDLERRLRDYAEGDAAPTPDFAGALELAVRHSRRRRAWPAVAATILVIAGVASAVAALDTGDRPQRAAHSADGGSAPGLLAGAITAPASDAPEELLFVIRQHRVGCRGYFASVDESATRVTVHLRLDLHNGPAEGVPGRNVEIQSTTVPGSEAPTKGSPSAVSIPAQLPPRSLGPFCITGPYTATGVQLRQPLGDREVVLAGTNSAVPVLSRSAPDPRYLPAGIAPHAHRAYTDVLSFANLFFDAGSLAPLAMGHYLGDGSGRDLNIITSLSDSVIPGAQVVGHVSINGHRATVTEHRGTRCVTWLAGPHNGLQVCSDGAGTVHAFGTPTLTKVARSLPH